MTQTSVPTSLPSTTSLSLVSTQDQTFQEHLYEIVDPEPTLENSYRQSFGAYDTLDFHAPLNGLQGHYQSTRTLKTLTSQEEFLTPTIV